MTELSTEAFETRIVGPLALDPTDSRTLVWIANAGPTALGSVHLTCDRNHVATLRDLIVATGSQRTRLAVSARLLAAVAEYAREQGILKLKVHRNSSFEWVPQQLARYGFKDADNGRVEFYLDLYYRPGHHRPKHRTVHPNDEVRLAC